MDAFSGYCVGWILGVVTGASLCWASHAKADEPLWLTVSLASYHADRTKHYRESNVGLGLEWQVTRKFALVGGEYPNSMNRETHYYGVAATPWVWPNWKLGATVAGVSGYTPGYQLVALPTVTFEKGIFGVNILASPKFAGIAAKVSIW